MELDLIVPDVEPNNNTSKDTKCPSPTSLVTTKIVGSSSATAHCANSASVKVGNMLTVNSSPSMSPAAVAAGSQCSVVNVTSRGLVPSMMIRPVVTLAPSSTGNALMLPQFVPIRPTSHTRQTNLQLPTVQVTPSVQMQAVPTNSKTLTLLPKTHVVQSTSTSGLPLPVVNVQITGSQHQQTQQQQTVQHPHQAQMTSSAHQGTHPAVTVVKLPPGTDIEALTTTAAASSVSQSSGSDSRGKAGQFWQYVCGDCPYSTSDYKLYKRHRSAAHDTSNMQTKVCHICNKGFLDLDNHLKVHENGRKHVCDVCDLGFHSPIELENHASRKHQGRQFLKCGYCDVSVVKEDISQHLNTCELFRKQQQHQSTK